ncbi:MAG: MFS transporter [Campylobacteraceae bacterium]|nr:MFS transporter [Campylobacteraceae bacterium]
MNKTSAMIFFLIFSRQLHLGTYFMVMPFFALYLKNVTHFSSSQTGIIIGMSTLTFAIFVLWIKHISDHINNKIFLFISYILWSISFLGFYFSQNFYSFLFFSFLSGISMCFSSVDRILLVILSEEKIYIMQKILRPIGYIVMGVAPLAGALLYEYNVKASFIITFFIFFVLSFLVLFFVNSDIPVNKEKNISFFKKISTVTKNKNFMIFILGNIILTTALASDNLLHSIYFNKQGFDTFMISFYFFCLAFLSFLSVLTLLLFKKKMKLPNEYSIGCILYAIGTSIYLMTTLSYAVIVLIAVFIALGDYFLTNSTLVIKKMSPKGQEGLYTGVRSFTDLAWFISPLFLGYLLDTQSRYYIFGIISLVIISMIFFRKSLAEI